MGPDGRRLDSFRNGRMEETRKERWANREASEGATAAAAAQPAREISSSFFPLQITSAIVRKKSSNKKSAKMHSTSEHCPRRRAKVPSKSPSRAW